MEAINRRDRVEQEEAVQKAMAARAKKPEGEAKPAKASAKASSKEPAAKANPASRAEGIRGRIRQLESEQKEKGMTMERVRAINMWNKKLLEEERGA
jgi:hypothetical protein